MILENPPSLDVRFTDENFDQRCPCLILLDISGSMHGDPIQELNTGLRVLATEFANDPLARRRVEIAMITFNDEVTLLHNFIPASEFQPPVFRASGSTSMGKALDLGLKTVLNRKIELSAASIPYYQPWFFLITDGFPTDEWRSAAARVQAEASREKPISVFCVGVQNADMNVLAQISAPIRPPMKLKNLDFTKLFIWITASLKTVIQSIPGDRVRFNDPRANDGWAETSS